MKSRRREAQILALDIGTSSVRCGLFDARAQPMRGQRRSASYRLQEGFHGAELDPSLLLRATKKSLRGLTTQPGLTISGCGFMHSLLGLDARGNPLTPIYTWADSRAAEDAQRLRENFDEALLQTRTGCMLRASFWPAKLLWLRRTAPKVFHRVARWVSPAEWIFEKLFEVRACSHSMASGTGLYDFENRKWDEELLQFCGLTNSKLNPLLDRCDKRNSDIFSAIGDGAASNIGSGATASGVVAMNVGTSAAVRAITARDIAPSLGLFRFVVDSERALLGGAVSNAGNLRAWCVRELRLPANNRAIEKVLRARNGDSRLTILPFWVGERAPSWPENLDGVIMGLTQTTTAADLLRACSAAVGHRLAQILEELEKIVGRARRIVVSGGILQSRASLQILADSLGRDLVAAADQEASLRGAAIYAAEQLGQKAAPPKVGLTIGSDRHAAAEARAARQRQVALEARLLPNDRAL